MTSIITGDIINSRAHLPKLWLESLKDTLSKFGTSPKTWEIYRGDSFQLETPPELALKTAILIKASIKQLKDIDVRLAIGIGEKSYASGAITESNGSAFVNSGECFENLKKTTLAVKSEYPEFDITINIMLGLALLTMNSWTPTTAHLITLALEHPDYNQKQLAKLTNSTQGNVSQGLKRSGYDEILKLLEYYTQNI
ncbi:transcriptional regulator [Formosa sp. S-31]|uniref:transcriptional regulator n=1 Tax=Formosa sp. S-31 TaxID=2790949 RepID=UPI003EC11FB0